MGTTLIILTSVLYEGVRRTQLEAFDSALYNHAVDIAGATDVGMLGNLVVKRDVLMDESKIFPFVLGQSLVQYRLVDGSVVLGSQRLGKVRLPLDQVLVQKVLTIGSAIESFELKTATAPSATFRIVNFLIRNEQFPPLILQVAVPLTNLLREQKQTLRLFMILIPIAILAAALTALFISNRALSAVNRIVRSAREIGPQELSARIPVPDETELGVLAQTLNEMLGRLQDSFESQDQFIADASHQLKTPLAIVRGEIEVFQRTERTKDESQNLIASVYEEVRILSKSIDDLLMLARFDSLNSEEFSRVRIDEVIFESISKLSKLAKVKKIEIKFNVIVLSQLNEGYSFEVSGDADLLRILFSNLIENAIKYSPESSSIQVRLSEVGKLIKIEVEDEGVGIAPDELPKIFARFYRSSNAGKSAPGTGLGLSIAKRIASLHRAELSVNSQLSKGTIFTLEIKNF